MDSATDLARAAVAELVAAGVDLVVVCPGSRSAPLAYAMYDAERAGRLRLLVRHDERVAGFTALGVGRATGRPAAVVTTSGSAVANLHPGILEAHHGRVPLLVLTADRPPRLRGTWANQTTDLQAGIFGAATRFARDLVPDDGVATWATVVRQGVAESLGGADGAGRGPGPVQLNLGFDEPLVPADVRPWLPEVDREPPAALVVSEPGRAPLPASSAHTVVLAGDGGGGLARAYAEALGLPLLAEPSSGARGGPNLVAPYRLLLDQPELGGAIQRVVVLGRPTLSRPVTRLLARPDVEVVLVQRYPDEVGPGRDDVTRVGEASVQGAVEAVATGAGSDAGAWLAAWRRAGAVASAALDQVLDGWPVLTGPLVAREVALATRPSELLVLAASNPVRDVDLAGPGWAAPTRVLANRGLSGIDGTVSTALGAGLGLGVPGRVLVGDVALLHDLGALVLGPHEARPDLTVVVVNDEGGGIFSLLEPGADGERDATAGERFDRLFGTPHRVDLAAACSGLGVAHRRVASTAGLREELGRTPDGLRVVEVRTDREDLRPLHDAITRSVSESVARSLAGPSRTGGAH